MSKPLKIAPWVVPEDLQAIYDYHKAFSAAKAERIVAEYDRVAALLEKSADLPRARGGDGACIRLARGPA